MQHMLGNQLEQKLKVFGPFLTFVVELDRFCGQEGMLFSETPR